MTIYLVVDGLCSGFCDVGGQDFLPPGPSVTLEHADQCLQGRRRHGQRW